MNNRARLCVDANIFLKIFIAVLILGGANGCTSSGPKTQFYSLFAHTDMKAHLVSEKTISIGVGPIVLPEYIDHPGIVSRTDSNRVIVSGYNAWAGDLKENMSRVLASNLSAAFELDQIWAFPWDNRIRPDYKVQLAFEEFSGVKGGEVTLSVRWSLVEKTGKTRVLIRKEVIVKNTDSSSYNDSVAALNKALNDLSDIIAENIAEEINRL